MGENNDTGAEPKRAEVWRAYFEASQLMFVRLEAEMRQAAGLSLADYNILLALKEAPEHRMRMGELAAAVVVIPSRATYAVQGLQKRGLVQLESSAEDRRGTDAVLTAHGEEVFAQAAEVHREFVRRSMLDHLKKSQINSLFQVFSRVRNRLS